MPAQLASDGRSPDDSPIAAFIDTLSGWGKISLDGLSRRQLALPFAAAFHAFGCP
jgi:hypothetical protein